MSVMKWLGAAVAGAAIAAAMTAAPAAADPVENPCAMTANFFCQFVPIAPELDHNVDLTQQLPPVDPDAPPPPWQPPDLCAMGCI